MKEPCRVPQIYRIAAQYVKEARQNGSSVKRLVYSRKHPNIKALYALVSEVLKHFEQLTYLIKKINLEDSNSLLSPWLARVLITELLWGKGKLPELKNLKAIQTVLSHKQEFEKYLGEAEKKFSLIKKASKPTYVRINTLKIKTEDAIKVFKDAGYTYKIYNKKDNYDSFLSLASSLKENDFITDIHFNELLLFSPDTKFYDSGSDQDGLIILQDKASCIPVYLLNPNIGSTVLDMCSAPGIKTTLIAALLKNQGTIYAVDSDIQRFQDLNKFVEKSGATCVKTINRDILELNNKDLPDVEYILIDPSCSGSGMSDHLDLDDSSVAKANQERLKKLAGFQILILKHALRSFPKAKRVVYSTCSLYPEENEEVVKEVLTWSTHFKLVPAVNLLKGPWVNFGSSKYTDIGNYCLYAKPEKDLTNGFFVAVFERLEDGEVNIVHENELNRKQMITEKLAIKQQKEKSIKNENKVKQTLPVVLLKKSKRRKKKNKKPNTKSSNNLNKTDQTQAQVIKSNYSDNEFESSKERTDQNKKLKKNNSSQEIEVMNHRCLFEKRKMPKDSFEDESYIKAMEKIDEDETEMIKSNEGTFGDTKKKSKGFQREEAYSQDDIPKKKRKFENQHSDLDDSFSKEIEKEGKYTEASKTTCSQVDKVRNLDCSTFEHMQEKEEEEQQGEEAKDTNKMKGKIKFRNNSYSFKTSSSKEKEEKSTEISSSQVGKTKKKNIENQSYNLNYSISEQVEQEKEHIEISRTSLQDKVKKKKIRNQSYILNDSISKQADQKEEHMENLRTYSQDDKTKNKKKTGNQSYNINDLISEKKEHTEIPRTSSEDDKTKKKKIIGNESYNLKDSISVQKEEHTEIPKTALQDDKTKKTKIENEFYNLNDSTSEHAEQKEEHTEISRTFSQQDNRIKNKKIGDQSYLLNDLVSKQAEQKEELTEISRTSLQDGKTKNKKKIGNQSYNLNDSISKQLDQEDEHTEISQGDKIKKKDIESHSYCPEESTYKQTEASKTIRSQTDKIKENKEFENQIEVEQKHREDSMSPLLQSHKSVKKKYENQFYVDDLTSKRLEGQQENAEVSQLPSPQCLKSKKKKYFENQSYNLDYSISNQTEEEYTEVSISPFSQSDKSKKKKQNTENQSYNLGDVTYKQLQEKQGTHKKVLSTPSQDGKTTKATNIEKQPQNVDSSNCKQIEEEREEYAASSGTPNLQGNKTMKKTSKGESYNIDFIFKQIEKKEHTAVSRTPFSEDDKPKKKKRFENQSFNYDSPTSKQLEEKDNHTKMSQIVFSGDVKAKKKKIEDQFYKLDSSTSKQTQEKEKEFIEILRISESLGDKKKKKTGNWLHKFDSVTYKQTEMPRTSSSQDDKTKKKKIGNHCYNLDVPIFKQIEEKEEEYSTISNTLSLQDKILDKKKKSENLFYIFDNSPSKQTEGKAKQDAEVLEASSSQYKKIKKEHFTKQSYNFYDSISEQTVEKNKYTDALDAPTSKDGNTKNKNGLKNQSYSFDLTSKQREEKYTKALENEKGNKRKFENQLDNFDDLICKLIEKAEHTEASKLSFSQDSTTQKKRKFENQSDNLENSTSKKREKEEHREDLKTPSSLTDRIKKKKVENQFGNLEDLIFNLTEKAEHTEASKLPSLQVSTKKKKKFQDQYDNLNHTTSNQTEEASKISTSQDDKMKKKGKFENQVDNSDDLISKLTEKTEHTETSKLSLSQPRTIQKTGKFENQPDNLENSTSKEMEKDNEEHIEVLKTPASLTDKIKKKKVEYQFGNLENLISNLIEKAEHTEASMLPSLQVSTTKKKKFQDQYDNLNDTTPNETETSGTPTSQNDKIRKKGKFEIQFGSPDDLISKLTGKAEYTETSELSFSQMRTIEKKGKFKNQSDTIENMTSKLIEKEKEHIEDLKIPASVTDKIKKNKKVENQFGNLEDLISNLIEKAEHTGASKLSVSQDTTTKKRKFQNLYDNDSTSDRAEGASRTPPSQDDKTKKKRTFQNQFDNPDDLISKLIIEKTKNAKLPYSQDDATKMTRKVENYSHNVNVSIFKQTEEKKDVKTSTNSNLGSDEIKTEKLDKFGDIISKLIKEAEQRTGMSKLPAEAKYNKFRNQTNSFDISNSENHSSKNKSNFEINDTSKENVEGGEFEYKNNVQDSIRKAGHLEKDSKQVSKVIKANENHTVQTGQKKVEKKKQQKGNQEVEEENQKQKIIRDMLERSSNYLFNGKFKEKHNVSKSKNIRAKESKYYEPHEIVVTENKYIASDSKIKQTKKINNTETFIHSKLHEPEKTLTFQAEDEDEIMNLIRKWEQKEDENNRKNETDKT